MHSIIRQGQFYGQLHGQFKTPLAKPLPQAAHAEAIPHAGPILTGAEWERRNLVRRAPNSDRTSNRTSDPTSGRIDVCRLIVATFGLALYLALPVAAVSFALNLLFG